VTNKERVTVAMETLGPNAIRVLADIADRLVRGAKEYGDFETERDWIKEAYEEELDNVIYRTMQIMSREGK
jgi:hypothetical protein